MTERAKAFVEFWVEEFLHPDSYEDEDDYSESRWNAAQCLEAAALRGISKAEIDEAFGDLVAYIAHVHELIVDSRLSSGPTD